MDIIFKESWNFPKPTKMNSWIDFLKHIFCNSCGSLKLKLQTIKNSKINEFMNGLTQEIKLTYTYKTLFNFVETTHWFNSMTQKRR